MCCIFTCCGWVIDLVQRLWTFTMACCISTAVCCAVFTSCMSGIALGYNYSLAEYIDLKETNVSVYLKRGVFDDEIADDMEWRRSGHMPVAGHIKEDDLLTAQDQEQPVARSGRRMDDSIFESDDHHRFEGSLMKLTAKTLFDPTTTTTQVTGDVELNAIVEKYPKGSIEQLKAIQSVINRRKMEALHTTTNKYGLTHPTIKENREEFLPHFPAYPGGNPGEPGRRMIFPNSMTTQSDSLRLAVPDRFIGKSENWGFPHMPDKRVKQFLQYEDVPFTFPTTPTIPGPLRPSRRRPPTTPRPEPTTPPTTTVESVQKLINEDVNKESFKDLDILKGLGREMDENLLKSVKDKIKKGEVSEDYEEDIKGLPVRRKRHVTSNSKQEPTFSVEDPKTQNKIPPEIQESENTTPSNYISKIVEVLKNVNRVLFLSEKIKQEVDSTTKTSSFSKNTQEHLLINPDILSKLTIDKDKLDLPLHTSGESTISASHTAEGISKSNPEELRLFTEKAKPETLLLKILKSTIV